MLKLKYLLENFDLARFALSRWRHDDSTLEERLKWFRISSNAVYPFDREGRLHFLCLSPAQEKDTRELLGELDFLTYLNRAGYPAMQPVPSDAGEVMELLDTPWGRWYASVFACVPGKPLEDVPMTDEAAEHYGAALGGLHRLSMRYVPPLKCRSHRDVLAWASRILEEQGASAAALAELREVSRLLAEKPRTRESYGLIHYDFEPDNVFWDGAQCHVIDFEDGMLHFYAVDVVQVLDEIPETYHEAFLRGYHDACPEVAADAEDFPLMRRFRNLYSYVRLLDCLSQRPEPLPEWLPALIAQLEARLQALETGFQEND